MRILFLAHRLPYPPNKGDKIRSFWELQTLARNHEVDLFCFYDDPKDQIYIDGLRHCCRSHYVEPISVLGSRLRALGAILSGRPFSTAFYLSPSMRARVDAAVRMRSYDLIFVFSSSMAQYAEPWPALPKILDLVDVDSDKWIQYARHTRGPQSWLWRREGGLLGKYEGHLVRSFCKTLICTEAEAKLLRSKAPHGEVEVLQNWLDTKYHQPESDSLTEEIRSLQPYVVFSGSMDYFPNVDAVQFFCREVLPGLRREIPGVRFVIAGRNPTAEVVRLSDHPAIHVTGTVADIRPYLRGALAAVAPMRIARGVQNKILEALSVGIAVVASSAAASALPVDLASLLLVADDPSSLVARLTACVGEATEQKRVRRNSVVRYVERLDLRAQLEALVGSTAATASVIDTMQTNQQKLVDESRERAEARLGA